MEENICWNPVGYGRVVVIVDVHPLFEFICHFGEE